MKKTFLLTGAGKDDARVRDKVRHEINKYAKRERRKPLPDGADRWELACKLGLDEVSAETLEFKELGGRIESMAGEGAEKVFVEVVASPRIRGPKPML
ncbi:MAG: hypothetical protein J6386_16010 [Candidatus Synoicihabitans palmerolidicus]|nr:hypothetical protein [Candidatus Synoicihabitans palmerolidicus]